MDLSINRALRVDSSSCIAFIGAGGKTTALFQLARKIQQPVIVTATSHLGTWQTKLADQHIIAESPDSLGELEHGLKGILLVTGELDGDRTKPVNYNLLHWLYRFCDDHAIPLLIEADGSRQKPLKAWAEHEPAIPAFTSRVIQVAGLSSLGKPLSDEFVHRAELFSRISGLAAGETITAEAIISALTHPSSGLKDAPQKTSKVVILNQADTAELQSTANGMVQPLLAAYNSVIISNLINEKIFAVHEPVAGIILAAGASSRYGRIKQLLDWHGESFVRTVAKTALEAGCSPVIVVTGANADQIGSAVMDLDVKLAHNPDWKSGQGSSIKTGILATQPSRVGGAIFLLADQPQVTISILRALMEKHAEELHPIVAPMVMDQRANPVLFDRSTFNDLASIQGDVGGRAIFHKHRVEYLPWHDDRLLLDVDTPEMYQRLISDET
jgi:molybdenum cofactor cytidylyltransferase